MVKYGGVDIKGEDELILFTCFAVATTRDGDNTRRLYDEDECKGVAGQLMQAKKPDFLGSTEWKKTSIKPARDKWRTPGDFEVRRLRAEVEKEKAKYLDKASQLLQLYHKSLDEEKAKEKADREKVMDSMRRRIEGGFGSHPVPENAVSTPRGRPQTHASTHEAGSVDAVSTAVSALSLNATSLPRGPPFQSPYEKSGTNQTQSHAEPEEDSIVWIGASEFITTIDYTEGKAENKCGSSLSHHFTKYYGAPGRARNTSRHAIENYEAWKSQQRKKAKRDEDSLEPPSGRSDPPPQRDRLGDKGGRGHHHAETGKGKPSREHEDAGGNPQTTPEPGWEPFVSSDPYVKEGEGKHRCTSRAFPQPHVEDNYGAPGSRHPFGGPPSPHAIENYEAYVKSQQEREKETKQKRSDPSKKSQESQSKSSSKSKVSKSNDKKPDKSRESQSKSSSKPKGSKNKKPDDSRGSQSGAGSKRKKSEDDNQGGSRRRKD